MRTLLLTDLHLTDHPRGMLESQRDCILNIIWEEQPGEVLFLGDVFMKRRPSPSVLLALKVIVDELQALEIPLTILRGNHDSETKADNGITALSLFSYHANVVCHTQTQHTEKRVFIPHYENDSRITAALEEVPDGYTVFGHFGYYGSLNSMGDSDFTIDISRFRNTSYLGHIHRFHRRKIGEIMLTVLGTPYTTNFTEAGKDNYYAILDGEDVEFKSPTSGPKHIVIDRDSFDEKELLESGYFKIVRVCVGNLSDNENHLIAREFLDKYPIDCLEIRYIPPVDEGGENFYDPKTQLFNLSRDMLSDYVDNSTVNIEKDYLLSGLNLIDDAYKEN